MTGFATITRQFSFGILTFEIRSINHRYLESYFRLPEALKSLEPQLKQLISKALSRGKIEIQCKLQHELFTQSSVEFNAPLISSLINIHHSISELIQDHKKLSATELMRFPNVLVHDSPSFDEYQTDILSIFDEALKSLIATRQQEGLQIAELITTRLDNMQILVQQAQKLRPEASERLREKLQQRLQDMNVEADQARLEQELVIYMQKIDIDEEIDRLNTHITEMQHTLKRQEAVGRRLDFLTQEMNREANTLGSKAQDIQITKIAIELKVLIEQIREQIQNIE